MPEGLSKSGIRLCGSLQQLQQKRRIVTRQLNHSFTVNYALCFTQRGLDNELIQRRTDKIGCVLKGVLHVLRNPGRNSAPIVRGKGHFQSSVRSQSSALESIFSAVPL